MGKLADLGDWEPDGPGPWVEAGFDSEASCCGMGIEAGDIIRADGAGGWEHKDCVGEVQKPSETACAQCHEIHAGECV
jgi:hypothetical protein